MLAGPPDTPVQVPSAVAALIAGRPYEVVWRNGLGGLTFRVGEGTHGLHVKWNPATSPVDLDDEVRRLRWAAAYTVVPTCVDVGADEEGSWFVTLTLAGDNAISPRWKADPAAGAAGIGRGLRALHDALPVDSCPFDWRAATRVARLDRAHVARRARDATFATTFGTLDATALAHAVATPPPEDLVVCHGDACAPNTLLDDTGECVGHTDLRSLGVGDRWADLAIAAWSTQWNYGDGWEDTLYDAYGVAPDHAKIRYYRLLWDLE